MTTNFFGDSSTRLRDIDGDSNVDTEHQDSVPKDKKNPWTTGLFGGRGYLWEDIDPAKAVGPLTMWCFLTGYMSVIHFIFFRRERNTKPPSSGIRTPHE